MFKVKGNYPYPILLEETIDYVKSTIKTTYYYQALKNAHNIKIECRINNDQIKKLIEDKKACYAVQVESPNAMYRSMFEFYSKDEISINIPNDEVIDFIEIGIAIIAKEDIENYQNDDFVESYKGIKMKVNKNEILAVCQSVKKIIILEDEPLKEIHSIFNLQKDSQASHITYDPNYDRILVKVPEEIGNYYLTSKGFKEKITILNAILFTPILTNIIIDIQEACYEDKLWYKTLIYKIDELAKQENTTKEDMIENAYETAQKLLKNITVEAINKLKYLLENQEGDDE